MIPAKAPGELGELAVLPVAAVGVDDVGDRRHQTRAIGSDHGQHKRCHAPQRTEVEPR